MDRSGEVEQGREKTIFTKEVLMRVRDWSVKMSAVSAVVALAACAETSPSMSTVPPAKSLYERLGGKPAISAVIDQFVTNVAADGRINSRFATTDIPKLKKHLVEQVCSAAGGPCTYTGRDMRTTHAGMGISNADFNALVQDLIAALDKFNVPAAEKKELLGLLGPMKKDIVEVP
jgi:hemoglobin